MCIICLHWLTGDVSGREGLDAWRYLRDILNTNTLLKNLSLVIESEN